jgi:hypothetical protein
MNKVPYLQDYLERLESFVSLSFVEIPGEIINIITRGISFDEFVETLDSRFIIKIKIIN